MKKNILKYGILIFLWFAYTLPALAGPGDPPTDPDPDPDPAPIDNWVLLLVFMGIVLGAYILTKHRKKGIA